MEFKQSEFAATFGVTRQTVNRWLKSGLPVKEMKGRRGRVSKKIEVNFSPFRYSKKTTTYELYDGRTIESARDVKNALADLLIHGKRKSILAYFGAKKRTIHIRHATRDGVFLIGNLRHTEKGMIFAQDYRFIITAAGNKIALSKFPARRIGIMYSTNDPVLMFLTAQRQWRKYEKRVYRSAALADFVLAAEGWDLLDTPLDNDQLKTRITSYLRLVSKGDFNISHGRATSIEFNKLWDSLTITARRRIESLLKSERRGLELAILTEAIRHKAHTGDYPTMAQVAKILKIPASSFGLAGRPIAWEYNQHGLKLFADPPRKRVEVAYKDEYGDHSAVDFDYDAISL